MPDHHPDPLIDQTIQHVRTLRENVESCQRQLDSYESAMSRAQKRRTSSGLDGISGAAFNDIMSHAEGQMPKLRQEMADYQKEADELVASLDINDRSYL
jgi:predicted  nucleic acid-binding Zn-ribbon protein